MEKLTFVDDHQELELNIDPSRLKDIPFFQGYLSNHFSKDKIYVPDAIATISSLAECSNGFQFIYQKLICADYLGIKPDLNVLAGISVPPEEFRLLLELVDYFGYDPPLIEAIHQNLPPDYELPNNLARLLKENYSKCLIHTEYHGQHLIYDVDTREYIHDFNEDYLSQHTTKIEYGREFLLINQDIIILHDSQFICAVDLRTNKIVYRIKPDDSYQYELSHDRKFLLVIYAEYVMLYRADNGEIFKKIMMSGEFIILSHDSKWILFYQNNICSMVSIESGEIFREFELSSNPIGGMKLSYDDKLLAVEEKNFPYVVRIIKLETEEEIFSSNAGNGYNFSTDSKKILINAFVLKIYDIYTQELILTFDGHCYSFPRFINSERIIFGYGDNIYLYDTDKKIQKLIGLRRGAVRVHLMP